MDLNDLSVLGSDKGEPMILQHPTKGGDVLNDEGKPMTIWLKSRDSKEFTDAKSRAKSFAKEKADDDMQRTILEDAYLLTKVTTKFENLQLNGKAIRLTDKSAMNLYTSELYPWIREQASIYILKRENFLGKAQSA